MTGTPLPWFFLVNDRPVKVVETDDGGIDVLVLNVLVLNMATGEFDRDLSYLSAIFKPYKDVDHLTEKEFNVVVESMRAKLGYRVSVVSQEKHG